jgi:DNA/RNA endonuclease YhcR with UshA esterase domain
MQNDEMLLNIQERKIDEINIEQALIEDNTGQITTVIMSKTNMKY